MTHSHTDLLAIPRLFRKSCNRSATVLPVLAALFSNNMLRISAKRAIDPFVCWIPWKCLHPAYAQYGIAATSPPPPQLGLIGSVLGSSTAENFPRFMMSEFAMLRSAPRFTLHHQHYTLPHNHVPRDINAACTLPMKGIGHKQTQKSMIA